MFIRCIKLIGFIIIGHGKFASGIYSACRSYKNNYCNVRVIDFPGNDILKLDNSIKEAFNELDRYDSIVVFCDLYEGSPFKSIITNLNYNNKYIVLSGVNLPIVLEGITIGQYKKCDACNLVKILKKQFPETLYLNIS